MQNDYFSAPHLTEFEDLQTFLKKRKEKKRLEKERKRQPLISTFFKRIKKEDNGYEADDETIIHPNILTPTPVKSFETTNLENSTSCKPDRSLTSASHKLFHSGVTLSAFTQIASGSQVETRSWDRDVNSPNYDVYHETTRTNTAVTTAIVHNVEKELHQEVGNESIGTIQPSATTGSEHDMVKKIGSRSNCTDQQCQTDVVPTIAQKVQTVNIAVSVKEVQTDCIEVETSGSQTEIITSTDQKVQTDLNASNIEEVGEIEVIKSLNSQPTQTDLEEILSLQPILPKQMAESHATFGLKSPEPNNDADSTISSCSKNEDYMYKPVSAGLDMRRGEYKELEFPPVSTSYQIGPKFGPPMKERSPSPMDLCVVPKSTASITQTASRKTKSATMTMTTHPFADIPKVKMSSIIEKKLTPAHQPQLKLMSDSKDIFGPSAIMSSNAAFIGHTARSVGRPSRVTDLSVKPMKSVGTYVSCAEKSQQPRSDIEPFGGKEIKLLSSFADVHKRSASPEAENRFLQQKRHVSTSKEPSIKPMETDIPPKFTPKVEGELSLSSRVGKTPSFSSNVHAANYFSVEEPFTPKRIIGLKSGRTISRGGYFKRTLGIGRGESNKFRLSKSSERVSMKSTVAIARLQEERSLSKLDMSTSEKTSGKRSHELLDKESADNTPIKKKKTVVDDKKSILEEKKQQVSKDKQEDAIEEPMKLPQPFQNDDESTLSFRQLQNAQNTSSDSVSNSQMDESKDSTYEPSKSTGTTSSNDPTNEESTDDDNDADNCYDAPEDEDIPSEHDVTQEANISVESDIINVKEGDGDNDEGEEVITIKVPNSALLSPKSREKRIKEYSQVIGKKGVKFSFAGGLPSIKCLLPPKQSDMRGFSDMKLDTPKSDHQQLDNSVEKGNLTQPMQKTNISNITVPSSPVPKENKPQANSTPKTQKYIILKQTETLNEDIVTNEGIDESMPDNNHPSSEPSANSAGDENMDKDTNEKESMETAESPGSAKLNSSSENQDQNGSGSDETNAPPSNVDLIPDKEFHLLYKGM